MAPMNASPTFGRRGQGAVRAATRPEPAAAPAPARADNARPRATMADLLARNPDDTTPLIPLADPAAPPPVAASEAHMALAIGPNWEAYRALWLDMPGRPVLRPAFSAAAFFLQGLWLLYRRQYAAFFGLVALTTAVLFVAPDFGVSALVFNSGVALALGFFGKSLVLIRACNVVLDNTGAGLSRADSAARIARQGGVDRLSPIVALLFATGVALAIFFHAAALIGAA